MAFKGAEIMCRVANGVFEFDDMRMTSYHNSVYTMIANNSVSLGSDGSKKRSYFDEASYGGSGRSAIFGPRGVEIAKAGPFETKEFAMIPMGAFRKKHRIPDVHMDIYKPVFDQYRPRYDHSAYVDYLPQDKREAFANFAKNSRWTHYW